MYDTVFCLCFKLCQTEVEAKKIIDISYMDAPTGNYIS